MQQDVAEKRGSASEVADPTIVCWPEKALSNHAEMTVLRGR